MTDDEALTLARAQKDAGKSIEEAFDCFKGRGCTLTAMIKAVRVAYGVSFPAARDALERRHPLLEGFRD
ncbi:MAG: hypothetical protein IPG45_16360 [Deltaproteobacteria bacterium]|jgi:hypothetical protein|nr:hypothetical protein [Deltaproteobacteria bacterium]